MKSQTVKPGYGLRICLFGRCPGEAYAGSARTLLGEPLSESSGKVDRD